MTARRVLMRFLPLLMIVVVGRAMAAPQVGSTLPPVRASDVTGEPQRLPDLIRGPTLLVAITDRDGGDAMRVWFDAAGTRAPGATQVSIISIGKPFFVGDGYARSKARERVPRAAWHASLMDTDHSLARALGLEENAVPYAFAIGPDGRVLAAVHGRADDPEALRVWAALRGVLDRASP